MAPKTCATLALFLVLSLNILFASIAAQLPLVPAATKLPTLLPASQGHCPVDTLQFGVCANLLGIAIITNSFPPPQKPCNNLIEGLLDFEAAVCFCGAINAGALGDVLANIPNIPNTDLLTGLLGTVPVQLNLLLNASGKRLPEGFFCHP